MLGFKPTMIVSDSDVPMDDGQFLVDVRDGRQQILVDYDGKRIEVTPPIDESRGGGSGGGGYSPPAGGIPESDLAQPVKSALGQARSALQPGDMAAWAKAPNKPPYTAAEVGAATPADVQAEKDRATAAEALLQANIDSEARTRAAEVGGLAVDLENGVETAKAHTDAKLTGYLTEGEVYAAIAETLAEMGEHPPEIDLSLYETTAGATEKMEAAIAAAKAYADAEAAKKADKEAGKGLSQNDFTDALKTRLETGLLGKTEKAADSDKLDGKHASEFLAAGGTAVDSERLGGLLPEEFKGERGDIGPMGLSGGVVPDIDVQAKVLDVEWNTTDTAVENKFFTVSEDGFYYLVARPTSGAVITFNNLAHDGAWRLLWRFGKEGNASYNVMSPLVYLSKGVELRMRKEGRVEQVGELWKVGIKWLTPDGGNGIAADSAKLGGQAPDYYQAALTSQQIANIAAVPEKNNKLLVFEGKNVILDPVGTQFVIPQEHLRGLCILYIEEFGGHQGDIFFGVPTGADGFSSFINSRIAHNIPSSYYAISGSSATGITLTSLMGMGYDVKLFRFD